MLNWIPMFALKVKNFCNILVARGSKSEFIGRTLTYAISVQRNPSAPKAKVGGTFLDPFTKNTSRGSRNIIERVIIKRGCENGVFGSSHFLEKRKISTD